MPDEEKRLTVIILQHYFAKMSFPTTKRKDKSMDFEQLKKKLKLPADEPESNWHRHENAPFHLGDAVGGWVQNTATVSRLAYVAEDATVRDNARLMDYAIVNRRAQISGNAEIEGIVDGCARISGNAKVMKGGNVQGRSEVTDNAVIGSGAVIYGRSRISGQAKISGGRECIQYCSIVVGGNTAISRDSVFSQDHHQDHRYATAERKRRERAESEPADLSRF